MFTIPTKPAGPVLPKWITGESPAPEVYHQVLEASARCVQYSLTMYTCISVKRQKCYDYPSGPVRGGPVL